MGVTGSGKTTMVHRLANATGGDGLDADDFHPTENKAKMTAGIPLTDDDRRPWLDRLNAELRSLVVKGKPVFLACSALKQKYRDRLIAGLPQARFVYLKGSLELIRSRLAQRRNHFMPAGLLESQFADLEEPGDAIVLDISKPEDQLIEDFLRMTKGERTG
jgi:gluconokinase